MSSTMNRVTTKRGGAILALSVAALAAAPPLSADAVVEALAKSKVSGNFRLRTESVDVDAPAPKDASALTLRSRLGIETAPLSGFSGILEFENIQILGGRDDFAPESAGYAPIVDPAGTEVNRAYLRYRGIDELDLGLGRQRIVLDNQRFVGAVAWRQDEQTFDAFTASYGGVPGWNVYYAYVDKVKGIASEKPTFNFDIDSADHLVNIAYSGFGLGKLSGYYYRLEKPRTQYRAAQPGARRQCPESGPALQRQHYPGPAFRRRQGAGGHALAPALQRGIRPPGT
ncbi:MAG: alginate export family protein [Porticoccaceae bacterium]